VPLAVPRQRVMFFAHRCQIYRTSLKDTSIIPFTLGSIAFPWTPWSPLGSADCPCLLVAAECLRRDRNDRDGS